MRAGQVFTSRRDRRIFKLQELRGKARRALTARAPPRNALRLLTRPPRRRPRCKPGAAMADVSERTLQLSVLVAFASGVLVGWQANRLRRRYLDWRKKRLQDKLAATQKKLDLA
nr:LOW QUALITY PROTEIN: mitoregulin [Globicephala melas]